MKKSKIIVNLILFISIIGFIFCLYKVINISTDYVKGRKEYSNIQKDYTKKSKKVVNGLPKYIDVNFDELNDINEDIVAWIRIPGTIINYPVVQSNNEEYLHKSIYKNYLYAGTIFLDENNDKNLDDKNSIFYGHNMYDGSMFGILYRYINKDYIKKYPYIQVYTKKSIFTYKIISYYETQEGSDDYKINFIDQEYKEWGDYIKSKFNKSINFDTENNTITLSTCVGSTQTSRRCVIHAQVINKEDK